MIVTYFRSSSLNCYDSWCKHKFYLDYVLSLESHSGKAADIGTCVHKIMEIMAQCKKQTQKSTENSLIYDDDCIGMININRKKFLDKDEEFFMDIINRTYSYYTKKLTHHTWTAADKRDVEKLCKVAVAFQNETFDPRNQTIFEAEKRFDISIDRDWAYYDYKLEDERINGNLALKGTIDLILKEDENTLHVVDYKGLTLDTKIPTPSGFKKMGDLKVGDIVFDENGEQTKITGQSEVKEKECYKLIFRDAEVICDEDHLWKLSNGNIVDTLKLNINDRINYAKPLKLGKKSYRFKQKTGLYRKIKSIKYIGKRQTQCIMVDSPSHTYLCTKSLIPTHNTGKHIKDWGTNQNKDLDYFQNKDKQLMMYYYALKCMYPEKDIIMTIFYIRLKKAFTVAYDPEIVLPKMEAYFKSRFNKIKNTTMPRMVSPSQSNFKCTKLCHFYKNNWDGSDKNICRFIHDKIREKGIDYVTENYGTGGHSSYSAPG